MIFSKFRSYNIAISCFIPHDFVYFIHIDILLLLYVLFQVLFLFIRNFPPFIKPTFSAVITAKSPMPVFGGRNDDDFPTFPAGKFFAANSTFHTNMVMLLSFHTEWQTGGNQ